MSDGQVLWLLTAIAASLLLLYILLKDVEWKSLYTPIAYGAGGEGALFLLVAIVHLTLGNIVSGFTSITLAAVLLIAAGRIWWVHGA